jgi:hypothetical protein
LEPHNSRLFTDREPPATSVKPSLSDYTVRPDLRDVNFIDMLNADDRSKAVIARQLFYARASGDREIYDVYRWCEDNLLPAFITVDVALHTFHVLFDNTLRALEILWLDPALKGLTRDMLSSSVSYIGSEHPDVREAALRNTAFFSVANALLYGDIGQGTDAEARKLAEAELALIEVHGGPAVSPMFGYIEDYSQFTPRGRYADHDMLGRYFKAMAWYGRMRFRLCRARDGRREIDRLQAIQALLIIHALRNGPYNTWKSIYGTLAFIVGESDGPTLYDYFLIYEEVYGDSQDIDDFADDARLKIFNEKASRLRPPAIASQYITGVAEGTCATFKLLGQAHVPDSYIFQQLTYDRVGSEKNPRLFPKGLDLMAVMGSKRAYEILADIYGEHSYVNYEANMARLASWFRTNEQEACVRSIYQGWVCCLRSLFHESLEGYPAFMKGRAWADKGLTTALGSWVELSHDAILYRKQSLSPAMAMPPKKAEEPWGYVEPEAELYGRLGSLASMAVEGLPYLKSMAPELYDKLNRFRDMMAMLRDISEKELLGKQLSEQEFFAIKKAGGMLGSIASLSYDLRKAIMADLDPPMPLAADVHTDLNTGTVLEEAIGHPYHIYVIVKPGEALIVAKGGMFSYYEFTSPLSDRLTDDEWRRMLADRRAPPPPIWTKSFLLE